MSAQPVIAMGDCELWRGDCRESMRFMKHQKVKVQMCVTSPPYYGLRDYGHPGQLGLEPSPEEYTQNMVDVFRCVRDVLADDGVLWLNLGDSYARMQEGNVPQGKNKDCIPPTMRGRVKNAGLKEKDLIGIPWRVAFALQEDGWYLRQDIIWHKPNPMPESVTDRCTKAHEYIFLLSKSKKYYYDHDAIKEPVAPGNEGSTLGFYPSRGAVVPGRVASGNESMDIHDQPLRPDNRNRRSVWTVPTKPYSGAHFATFPPALIEPCILAGSRKGDVVLDPFGGSGTTGAVAISHGRLAVLCELNEDYANLIETRINGPLDQPRLFEDAKVGAGDTAVQGDMLLPANAELRGDAPPFGAASLSNAGLAAVSPAPTFNDQGKRHETK